MSTDGIWKSRGYGWLLKVDQQHYSLFDVTDISCIEFERGTLAQFHLGFDVIVQEMNRLVLRVKGDITHYEFERSLTLPDNVLSLDQPRIADPNYNFEVLWETFSQDYAFFERHDVDWQKVYSEYRPQVTSQTTEAELFELFKTMLMTLQDNHVHLYGNGESFSSDKIALLKKSFCDSFELETASLGSTETIEKYQRFISLELLHGKGNIAGNNIFSWGYVTPDIAYLCILRLFGIADTPEAKAATGLPEARDQVATFLEQDMQAIETILDAFMEDIIDAESLVIDIRVNGGGFDRIGMAIANRFADKKREAFNKCARWGENFCPQQQFFVEPEGEIQFTKPIYVLIAERCASAGEILALCLNTLPHVTYVGQPTLGILSDDLAKHLPNGWKTTISNEVYTSADGKIYECCGLPPNIEAPVLTVDNLRKSIKNGLEHTVTIASVTLDQSS